MPISTLNNISVPTEDGQSSQGLLMPKLQYRFRVLFDGFGGSDPGDGLRELTRQVVDVTRPNISFEQITLDVYNSRSYLAGKHTWEPITLTLRDDMNNRIQKTVGQQLQKQFDFFEQASAVAGGSYKFSTKIEILDGGNGAQSANILDRYHLVGCYLDSVNYNTLAYATSEPVTITLSIRYDNAIQFGRDGSGREGVGSIIARDSETSIATGQTTGLANE